MVPSKCVTGGDITGTALENILNASNSISSVNQILLDGVGNRWAYKVTHRAAG